MNNQFNNRGYEYYPIIIIIQHQYPAMLAETNSVKMYGECLEKTIRRWMDWEGRNHLTTTAISLSLYCAYVLIITILLFWLSVALYYLIVCWVCCNKKEKKKED